MLKFDLEKAKRGHKVKTRDGTAKAEYIFTLNTPDSCRHVFKFTDHVGQEYIRAVDCEGFVNANHGSETAHDLFMEEPEIPEGWTKHDGFGRPYNIYSDKDISQFLMDDGSILSLEEMGSVVWYWADCNAIKKIIAYRVTKWKEERPSLEDARNNVSREIYDIVQACSGVKFRSDFGVDFSGLTNSLQQFAEAIIQRAVEEARKKCD